MFGATGYNGRVSMNPLYPTYKTVVSSLPKMFPVYYAKTVNFGPISDFVVLVYPLQSVAGNPATSRNRLNVFRMPCSIV